MIGLRDDLLEPLLLIGVVDGQRPKPLETRSNLAGCLLERVAEFRPLRQQEATLRALRAPHLQLGERDFVLDLHAVQDPTRILARLVDEIDGGRADQGQNHQTCDQEHELAERVTGG